MFKTCERCGEPFVPKFPQARLCYPCWLDRKYAIERADALELALAEAHRDIADLRKQLAAATGGIPSDLCRTLLSLCHPDRHGNSPAANKVTAWLLTQRAGGQG